AHVLDAHELSCWRLRGGLGKQVVKVADPGSGPGFERAGRNHVDPNSRLGELAGDIACTRFERRLDWPHNVVVFDDALGPVVAHGEKRAPSLHQRLRKPGHPYEGMAGDIHRL